MKRRLRHRALYAVTLTAAHWTRMWSDTLADTATALENVAGELAPFPVTHDGNKQ